MATGPLNTVREKGEGESNTRTRALPAAASLRSHPHLLCSNLSTALTPPSPTDTNNRTVSYVRNGSLVISPKLTASMIGEAGLMSADVNRESVAAGERRASALLTCSSPATSAVSRRKRARASLTWQNRRHRRLLTPFPPPFLAVWGGDPATACTDNGFFGCERTGGGGGNIINPVLSARLRTAESFAFKYGRVEVVARLPRGDWMWPAIWLMPTNAAYGTWPASGEIDIVESRGNARGYAPGGCESMSSTLHYGPFWPADDYLAAHESYSAPSGDLTTEFHTYGLLWTQERLTTYIDSTVVLDVAVNESFWARGGWAASAPGATNPWADSPNNVAPFDQRMYIILNVAVGGTNGYFPDGAGGKPWQDTSNNAANEFWGANAQWLPTWTSPMMVDSVRVWQDPAQGGDYALRPML